MSNTQTLLLLPGDGIGPEVTEEARRVAVHVAPDLLIESAFFGGVSYDQFGTPLTENMPSDYSAKMIAESPFPHRMGEPDEYASLAMHLIDNSMMNGEVVRIDAGMRMAPSAFR